jgi:hypothetical protein
MKKINFNMLLPTLMFLAVSAISAFAQESPAKYLNTSVRNFYIRAYVVTSDLVESQPPVTGFGSETKYLSGLFSMREREFTSDEFFARLSKAEQQNINLDRQISSLAVAANEKGKLSIGSRMAVPNSETKTLDDVLADGVEIESTVIPVEDESGRVVSVNMKYDVNSATIINKDTSEINTFRGSGDASFPTGKIYLLSARKNPESKKETLLFVEVSEIVFKKTE